MGLLTRPLFVGIILVAIAMSLLVFFMLKKDSEDLKEPQSTPPSSLTQQEITALNAPQFPNSAVSNNVVPRPAENLPPLPVDNEPKPVSPPPPPAEVSWSKLNEQIHLLEEMRVTLINTVIPLLPQTEKTDEIPDDLPAQNETITALNLPAIETVKKQPTWFDMVQQIVLLEQQRQDLIHLAQSQLIKPADDFLATPIHSLSMSEPHSGEQLKMLNVLSETDVKTMLDEFKLNPIDTADSLNSHLAETGYVFILKDVAFSSDNAELRRGHLTMLSRLAKALNRYSNYPILIEGHTDHRGQSDYNLDLSQRRALAVRQALLDYGVEASRIQVKAHGDLFPIGDNQTETGRASNRRVEITLLTYISISELKAME